MGGMGTSPLRSVMFWSVVISLLVIFASVAGLVDPVVYGQETQNWATQAKGQDLGNLFAVVVLLLAAYRYGKGSVRAGLVWLGTLLYLVYAYVVYAMAVHFNGLFLVYVAVLGLSAWAVIFTVPRLRQEEIRHPEGFARNAAAYTLIVTGVMFAVLWLSDVVPALLAGQVPASITQAGLWVNPIHVIDLSMVLPGFIISGIAALRSRAHGLFWMAPWLVFSVLMGASIIAGMGLSAAAGAPGTVPPTVMVSIVVLVSWLAVSRYLRRPAPSPE